MDRRDFLTTAGASLAAACAGLVSERAQAQGARQGGDRGYISGHFALELDGKFAGWLQTFHSGPARSGPVAERQAAGRFVEKHTQGFKSGEIALSFGAAMSKPFYDWIKGALEQNRMYKDGAIVTADAGFNEVARLSFFKPVS